MRHIKKALLGTALGVILVTACNRKEFTDLNINPQAGTTINLNFLFSSAQLSAASAGASGDNRYIDWRSNIGMFAYAIQQLANIGGGIAPGDKYTENFESSAAPFEFFYFDALKHLGEVLRQTSDTGFAPGQYKSTRQAARIVKAFLFHRLTDYYGSIPYFDALKARDGIFYPKYDKQKDIYMDLLKELDEATAGFVDDDPENAAFGRGDLYFNGDLDKWRKFGYSLMLRLAMRISNVDPATANTYVGKAIAGGVFESNTDNVVVRMAIGPSEWTNQNGISRAFNPGDGGQPIFMSKTLINFLKGTDAGTTADDDPRLMILSGGIGTWSTADGWKATNADPLAQKGMPNGQDEGRLKTIEGIGPDDALKTDELYSKINIKLLDDDEPYMLMNYGEVEFYLAEAAERGIGGLSPADAKGHYDAGVRASMQMLDEYDPSLVVTDAQVDTYLSTYPYGVTKPALEMIGEQLWANHFLNWWEAWSDWRRTGYPVLEQFNYPGNITGGTIPQRLTYPTAESAGNPNFGSGSTQPNLYTTKVWWAGGPE